MLNKRNQWKAQAKYLNRLLRENRFDKTTRKVISGIGLPHKMRMAVTYTHIDKWKQERENG